MADGRVAADAAEGKEACGELVVEDFRFEEAR